MKYLVLHPSARMVLIRCFMAIDEIAVVIPGGHMHCVHRLLFACTVAIERQCQVFLFPEHVNALLLHKCCLIGYELLPECV